MSVEGVDEVLSECALLIRSPMPQTHGDWQSSLVGLTDSLQHRLHLPLPRCVQPGTALQTPPAETSYFPFLCWTYKQLQLLPTG